MVFTPYKTFYVIGGLNDLLNDKTTFSARNTRVKEIPLNFIESKYEVKEMEVM